jgi:uncharacterized protein
MDFNVYLPATTLAAVVNGALLLLMTAGIAIVRNRQQISYGDGGDARFAKRQRGHANGVEQIPIALILLALAELQGAPSWLVWSVATGLSVGRIFHAVQFWFKGAPFVLRPTGVFLTLIAKFAVLVWLTGAVIY